MEHISLGRSKEAVNKFNFEEHQNWLDNVLSLNKQSSLFYFIHISDFLQIYATKLGIKKLVYIEKQFYFALDLKLIDWAEALYKHLSDALGEKETKVLRYKGDLTQIYYASEVSTDSEGPIERSLSTYKRLIKENQNDCKSIKAYLSLIKSTCGTEELKTLVDYYNEYLKVYMDDVEIWSELADIYISTLNYNKAIFCLEEVLIHSPNNFQIYIKIGDLLASFNNTESATQALKYYSRSILLKPTPRAFWGIVFIANIFVKYKKPMDDSLKKLLKISNENLKNYYPPSLLEDLVPKPN